MGLCGSSAKEEKKKEKPDTAVIDKMARSTSFNKFEEVLGGQELKSGFALTEKQKAELWDFYDKDKNGELDMDEMKTVMKHMMRYRAKHASKKERRSVELRAMVMTPYQDVDFDPDKMAQQLYTSLDKNHDGVIERSEFIELFDMNNEACKVS